MIDFLMKPTVGENNKFYYVYKISCLLPEKPYYYLGKHETFNLDDNYMGSGVVINRFYKEHGIENFKKEIIGFFKNSEELLQGEEELIGELYKNDPWCLNLCGGGKGTSGKNHSKETRKKISEANKGKLVGDKNPMKRTEVKEKHLKKIRTEEYRKSISESNKKAWNKLSVRRKMEQRTVSEKSREKMSESQKGKRLGELNPAKREETRCKLRKAWLMRKLRRETEGENDLSQEYSKLALEIILYDDEMMTPLFSKLSYLCLGLTGETGELCDKFKKIVRDDRCHVTPKNLYLLKSEIADILWYLTAITNELGSSLSEIMDISLDKIQDRINRDQLQGSGDER